MDTIKVYLKDKMYSTGLACIFFSGFVYALPLLFPYPDDKTLLLFYFNYSVSVVYFFILFLNRKNIDPDKKLKYRLLLLILLLISAYSLNRNMNVFEESVNWLSVALSVSCANYILFSFIDKLPAWARQVSSFISGFSLVLFSYLAVYLIPLYPVGIIGLLAVGISIHVYVPSMFVINTVYLVKKAYDTQKNILWSFLAGIAAPVLFAFVFMTRWNHLKNEINQAKDKAANKGELPSWVYLAQKIPNKPIAEKMLKADLVYSVSDQSWSNIFWQMPNQNFTEKKKHDPLVLCSALFCGIPDIIEKDRIQILRSVFKNNNQAEERLWSGNNLFTEQVITTVKLWPVCNIAYTEKTITVSHAASERSFSRQQEAIYTFYLPEGGVVTSLSLWINGKEEKSVLTTKEKADSAYKRIVGTERRDPSVVHWQEGNRVSLRVFPVLPGESRMFKLGITAPLERVNGNLVYENIYFDGPDKSRTRESIHVDFEQSPEEFHLPANFVSMGTQSFARKGGYEPYWSLLISDKGLAGCTYSFDGNAYSLKAYHKKLSPAFIEDIYLDLNRSWTKAEFDKVIEISVNRNVFVFDGELTRINGENKDGLFKKLQQDQFSLFPVYKIKKPASSILVTKNSAISCDLDDLDNTAFMDGTKQFLSQNQKIKLFNIGTALSPYLKSMKEYRIFQYDEGDLGMLNHILSDKIFADDLEDDNRVIIYKADMVIEKTKGILPATGPDHIMRLFAYNHIMHRLGAGLLMNRPIEDSLVEEARKAYVVSPLSSLVVLETEEDFKRFDIKDTGSSLKNASLTSKGAVPEPHEWLLIITGALLILYIKFRSGIKWAKT